VQNLGVIIELNEADRVFRWSESDKEKADEKLPEKQQFLITRQVVCEQRIKDIEQAASSVMEVDVGDGWVETQDEQKELDADEVLDLDDEVQAHVVPDADADDDEIVDLDDLEEDGGDNIFASDEYVSKNAQKDVSHIAVNPKLRKYDLSITYDYYH
jgi:hypothetical protein